MLPGAVAAMPKDFVAGFEILPHHHERAQLIHATRHHAGFHRRRCVDRAPSARALGAGGVRHAIVILNDTTSARSMSATMWRLHAGVVPRDVGLAASARVDRPGDGTAGAIRRNGPAGHVVALILLELRGLQALPLQLPMPRDTRLRALCEALLAAPGDQRPLEAWAETINTSARTLARRFQSETVSVSGPGASRRACWTPWAAGRVANRSLRWRSTRL